MNFRVETVNASQCPDVATKNLTVKIQMMKKTVVSYNLLIQNSNIFVLSLFYTGEMA